MIKLAFIKDDAKKIGAFITEASTVYQKRDDYLHYAGIIGFYHAQQHGDPVFIQKFYNALKKGHQNTFRAWLGKLSKYELDGETSNWLGFKDNKFFVRSGTENIRKGVYEPEMLVEMTPWFKKDKVEKPVLEGDNLFKDLCEKSVKVSARIKKLWEDNDVTMTSGIKEALHNLEAALKA